MTYEGWEYASQGRSIAIGAMIRGSESVDDVKTIGLVSFMAGLDVQGLKAGDSITFRMEGYRDNGWFTVSSLTVSADAKRLMEYHHAGLWERMRVIWETDVIANDSELPTVVQEVMVV